MRRLKFILLASLLSGAIGCKDYILDLIDVQSPNAVELTLDKPTGRYDPMPSQLDITFPISIDMATVTAADFTVQDTCAGTVAVTSATSTAYVVTVGLSGTGTCTNTQTYTVTVDFFGVKRTDGSLAGSTNPYYVYTFDNVAPTVTAVVNSLSEVSSSASFEFSSIPSFVTFTFSSDIDLDSVAAGDFAIATTGGTNCTTMPTIGTLTKSGSAHTVRVALSGANCADGQGFQLTLAASSVGDTTLSGTTGLSSPHLAPSASFTIGIIRNLSGVVISAVGNGLTSATGIYKLADVIDIQIDFDRSVVVDTTAGTPAMRLNLTGTGVKYATYASGSATSSLIFQYTVGTNDSSSDLDYYSTTALVLNGGKIWLGSSGGGVDATLTLAAPGSPNSLGGNRNLALDGRMPTVSSANPTGTTNTWGLAGRTVTYTFSEQIDAASLVDGDLVVNGTTCATPPTVTGSSVTGGSSNVVNFTLSSNSCAHNEVYTLTFDPASVTDVACNTGGGSVRVLTVTTSTLGPTVALGSPSQTYVNAAGSVAYTVTYSGASAVTLANADVNFAGASTGCSAAVTGSGLTTRTITITSCSGDGVVQISLDADTASNTLGNTAGAVPETSIADFIADNTVLPNPTHNLPTVGLNVLYDEITRATFTLTFTGDVLGTAGAVQSALGLNCNSGGGANPVGFSAARTSNTVATVTPTEAASDFVYAADCVLSGTNVPDAAGNLATITSLNFKVAGVPSGVSGPSGSVSIASATVNGHLGNVVFNVPLNTVTLDNVNVLLTCAAQDVAISSFVASNADKTFTVDFDEADTEWLTFVGGEACSLAFSTAVTNSLGQPLASTLTYNFTLVP